MCTALLLVTAMLLFGYGCSPENHDRGREGDSADTTTDSAGRTRPGAAQEDARTDQPSGQTGSDNNPPDQSDRGIPHPHPAALMG